MKTKLFAIFIAILLLFTTTTVSASANNVVELKLTNTTVYAGDEFELKLLISDNSKLSGAVIDIKYDSSNFEFVSAQKGAIIDDGAQVSIRDIESSSKVRFTYMAPSAYITSEGILLIVKFKALNDASGQFNFNISIPTPGDFVNSELKNIEYSVVNSTVKVINSTTTTQESTVESSTEETSSLTDTSTTVTESETTPKDVQNNANDVDDDNLRVAVGILIAGFVIVIGAIIYFVINRKRRGK